MWYVIREDELYHHGILGQRWGVRRFQNKDGTLTAAGRRRYGEDGGDAEGTGQRRKINGKKIAVAAGVTVAAAVGVGLAVKYRKEIGSVIMRNKKTSLDDLIKTAEKTKAFRENVDSFTESKKLSAYNLSNRVQQKAASELTKAGMVGREFAKNQKGKLVEAANKAISEGSSELSKAAMVAVAGIGAKKLSEAKDRYDQSGSKNAVTEVLLSSGNKGIDSFISSIKNSSGGNNSNNGKANGNAGATVGKDLANKLGPARQEQYSPSDQKRYDRLFQDNSKVKGNDNVRLTVKALKRAGYSIDQINTYLDGV